RWGGVLGKGRAGGRPGRRYRLRTWSVVARQPSSWTVMTVAGVVTAATPTERPASISSRRVSDTSAQPTGPVPGRLAFRLSQGRTAGQDDMGRILGGDVLGALESQRGEIEPREQMLATAEEHRSDGEVHLVDQPRLEVLPDRRHTTAEPDVLASGCLAGALQRLVDAPGDEVEGRPAVHRAGCARVTGQHEDLDVVRRSVAPPSLPRLVRPATPDGTEHVSPEDPGADAHEASSGECVVHAGGAFPIPEKLLEGPGRIDPLVQGLPADAEGILQGLTWSCAEAVEGDADAADAQSRHG